MDTVASLQGYRMPFDYCVAPEYCNLCLQKSWHEDPSQRYTMAEMSRVR